jgi:hypothetical protein
MGPKPAPDILTQARSFRFGGNHEYPIYAYGCDRDENAGTEGGLTYASRFFSRQAPGRNGVFTHSRGNNRNFENPEGAVSAIVEPDIHP